MFYTVLEVQVLTSGVKSCAPFVFDDYNAALAKFFTICVAASTSEIPYHAAFVLQDTGNIVKAEIFDRRIVEA